MQERHIDRKQYFFEQGITTKKYVIPYIEQAMKVGEGLRVLEVGCGEGGNMVPFIELGCHVVGVDLNEIQIGKAVEYMAEVYPDKNIQFVARDIYETPIEELGGAFDLIILRDVIEHIYNQERFMAYIKAFMKPNGLIFFGFPPWQMPFGGHQQICRSKFLSKLPYFHLLPAFMYGGILRLFGEHKETVAEMLELKKTGISIERFRRIARTEKYITEKEVLYFINPNYEIKFKLTPRKLWGWVGAIPWVRNFYATCCYSLLRKPAEKE
jgi:SAM-dependent methyltransferase